MKMYSTTVDGKKIYKAINKPFIDNNVYYASAELGTDVAYNNFNLVKCYKVGDVDITDGIASNFSLSNYLKIPTPFKPGANVWEKQYCLQFDYPDYRANFALDNSLKSDYLYPKISIQTENSSRVTFQMCLSSNGTEWDINISRSNYTAYDYSKKTFLKQVFTGNNYILYFKQEGEEFRAVQTIHSSNIIAQPNDNIGFSIGADITAGLQWNSYIPGKMYLDETYIKIGSTYFFRYDMNISGR